MISWVSPRLGSAELHLNSAVFLPFQTSEPQTWKTSLRYHFNESWLPVPWEPPLDPLLSQEGSQDCRGQLSAV